MTKQQLHHLQNLASSILSDPTSPLLSSSSLVSCPWGHHLPDEPVTLKSLVPTSPRPSHYQPPHYHLQRSS